MAGPKLPTRNLVEATRRLQVHLATRSESLRWHYALGQLLNLFKKASEYGDHWQRDLSERFRLTRSTIYRALRFARLFTEAEVVRWDGRISWAMFSTVLHVRDAEARTELLQQAVDEKLSQRELSARIGKKSGGYLPRGGRKPARPESKGTPRDITAFLRSIKLVVDLHSYVIAPAGGGAMRELRIPGKPLSKAFRKTLESLRIEATKVCDILPGTIADLDRLLAPGHGRPGSSKRSWPKEDSGASEGIQ